MSVLRAVGRPFAWLLGTRGEARFRAVVCTRSWVELCQRVEDAVRTAYPTADGYEFSTQAGTGHLMLHVCRGRTAGFLVGLVASFQPTGETRVTLGVSRWSQMDRWRVGLAVGIGSLGGLAAIVALTVAGGGRFPGEVMALISLVAVVVVTMASLRLLAPVSGAAAHWGGNRLTDAELAAVGELVCVTAEECPATTVTREPIG